MTSRYVLYTNRDSVLLQQTGKPKAKRWDRMCRYIDTHLPPSCTNTTTDHLTEESKARVPCSLKQAARFLKEPGILSLGGGLPSSAVFPFESISMKVPTVPNFSEADTASSGTTVTMGKYDARDGISNYDLSIALNYGQATGGAQMMRFLTEHTEMICNPPYADWGVCQSIGSTGALDAALRMFCEKNRGDAVLTDEFSFSTALEAIVPLGIKAVGISVDNQGILPEVMDELLSNWDAKARGSRKPHVLYTVPSGQNPTGATQSLERRQAIYKVAQKHDIYILEDEPYYFLQMEPYKSTTSKAPSDVKEFIESLIPTYVSLDVDGRVMRLDSFSKVLMPGSRHGWVVASEQIIERFQRHAEVTTQGPNGLSQVLLHKLLDETWGHEGYLRWLMDLRSVYTVKRDALLAACEKHLPTDLITWTPPAAGMFVSSIRSPTTYFELTTSLV